MRRVVSVLLAVLASAAPLAAKEAERQLPEREPWILSVYLSTWINRCDVPAAAQLSGFTPAVGPSFALSKGPWRFSAAGYIGEYDFTRSEFSLVEGQTHPQFTELAPGNTLLEWSNDTAQRRGLSVQGKTRRQDLAFSVGYRFSSALQLGFAVEYNHRDADYTLFLPLAVPENYLPPDSNLAYQLHPVPGDPQNRALFGVLGGYEIDQFWLGPQFHGFIPLAARVGGFYNASVLVLAYESRRAPVYFDEEGDIFPPGLNADIQLPQRGFADNFGAAFSLGASYSLTPRVAVWGGYSLKFFAEQNTDLLDHSTYQGPYFGVGYVFF
jgi:hypothetical protein